MSLVEYNNENMQMCSTKLVKFMLIRNFKMMMRFFN